MAMLFEEIKLPSKIKNLQATKRPLEAPTEGKMSKT